MSAIGYNITTPHGRAIQHVLDNTVLRYHMGNSLTMQGAKDGRLLTVSERFNDFCSDGEASLVILLESLAGMGSGLNLLLLLEAVDEPHKLAIAQAVWMAAGFAYLPVVNRDDDKAAAEMTQ